VISDCDLICDLPITGNLLGAQRSADVSSKVSVQDQCLVDPCDWKIFKGWITMCSKFSVWLLAVAETVCHAATLNVLQECLKTYLFHSFAFKCFSFVLQLRHRV